MTIATASVRKAGNTALIAGSSDVIGRAVASQLSRNGAIALTNLLEEKRANDVHLDVSAAFARTDKRMGGTLSSDHFPVSNSVPFAFQSIYNRSSKKSTHTFTRKMGPCVIHGQIAPLGSASHARLFSSDSKSLLLDILAKEEQEEKESGNVEMPAELMDLKTAIEQDWRIVEDGATTSLFRIEHSHKVQVSFHCQDTVEEVIDEYGETVEEDEETSAPVRFTVTVTKAGKSLVFACFSEYGQVKIEGISTTATSVETVHSNQGTLAKTEYQGPDFIELAEELQDQLHVYLDEECGVNSDVAAFIAMFSDYREQMCYVNWLKEAQAIAT